MGIFGGRGGFGGAPIFGQDETIELFREGSIGKIKPGNMYRLVEEVAGRVSRVDYLWGALTVDGEFFILIPEPIGGAVSAYRLMRCASRPPFIPPQEGKAVLLESAGMYTKAADEPVWVACAGAGVLG